MRHTERVTSPVPSATQQSVSPYVEFDRQSWSKLSASTPQPLTAEDIDRLRGLGDPIDLTEVDTIYRPLSRLLSLYVASARGLNSATSTFLGEELAPTPYVIGVAGSVAVGKSTVSRLLRELLRRWSDTPQVQLVTTDGFLHPNAELERRGLMARKGFPESYDQRGLLRFLSAVKAGVGEVRAPVYDHLTYDIVPGEHITVHRPDVLIVEGLNVLQPARTTSDGAPSLAVSDFFDFSIYVDARTRDVRSWYVNRFLSLRETAFTNPRSYFRRYAELDDEQAVRTATSIWETTNEPNLVENILPTRGRATLVLTKAGDHRMHRMRLRKI